jgi:hypothetical protein
VSLPLRVHFRRLFTLSEFYDRVRDSFYAALQQVRVDLDLTGWLEYFVHGLATQLAEVRTRVEIAIRSDVIAPTISTRGKQQSWTPSLRSLTSGSGISEIGLVTRTAARCSETSGSWSTSASSPNWAAAPPIPAATTASTPKATHGSCDKL